MAFTQWYKVLEDLDVFRDDIPIVFTFNWGCSFYHFRIISIAILKLLVGRHVLRLVCLFVNLTTCCI